MDQGWRSFRLLILVVFLILLKSAVGFKGGFSETHPRWVRPASDSLSPRAVQSSLSEVPLTGKFPVEEVGSGVLPDRSQKSRSRFANLRQYVKGGVSSSYESTSRTQTVPSGSVSASFALPQNEHHASSLTSLQLQGSSSSSVQDIASQLASGQSFKNQNASSSQGSSGLQSVGGSSQLVSLQGEGSNSGLSSPGISSQSTPDLYTKISSSSLITSSHATSDQSSPSLYMSSFPGGSGLLLEASSSASGQGGVSSYGDLSLQSQGTSSQYAPATSGQFLSSPVGVSSQSASDTNTLGLYASSSQSSSALQSAQVALPTYTQESLSSSPSIQAQGSTSQDSSRSELAGGSMLQSSTHELSGSYSGLSQSIPSQYSPGSLTSSKLSSMPLGLSSQPTSSQSLYRSSAPSRSGTPLATSSRYGAVQRGSSSRDLSSLKTPGTSAQNAPASPSKYVPMSSPQAVSSQSGGNQGLYRPVTQVGHSQAGASGQFMGASSFSSGSIPQSQGSLGQNAPASPSKYVSMSSPQGVSSQSTSLVSSQGSSSTLLGAASRFASQGLSSTYSGSVQSQGTISQLVSGYPTYSKLGSLPLVSSQSTSDQSSGRLTPTLQAGSQPQKVSRQFLSPQGGSSYYSGPLPQSQGSLGQNAFASPSKYVPMSSPQAVSSQSGGKQDLYRPVTQVGLSQAGASGQFMGASSFSSGSIPQSQGSLDQFASASPSKYVSMSSPQGVSSQSTSVVSSQGSSSTLLGAASRFASQGLSSSYSGSVQSQGTVSQLASGSPTYSKLSSLPLVSSQSTSHQSSGRLTPTLQVGSQPQEASRQFLSPQGGSSYYTGSLPQSQGSFSQYAPASPSKYVSMSSHQGLSSQSAPAPSSRRGLTSTFLGSSGSQSGSSLGLQSSSTYGGSYQPQGTRTQFASGSPSQYGSVSLASPQDVASQYGQASQSVYSLSQSQEPQRWQPSATSLTQGIQASGAAMSQGSYQSQSSQMLSRSSSLSSALDSTYQSSPPVLSVGSDQLVSTQGRGDRYSGMFLQSPSTSNLYTRGSPAYAKLGSSPLGFTSQSTSDQSSSSLYGSSSQTRAGVQLASSQYASLQGGSSSVGSASQPQSIASQYAPAHLSVDLKAPVSSLYSQASPSGSSPSLRRQSQKLQPSASSWTQGVQTSDTAALQSIPSSVQSGQTSTSASWRTQGLLSGVQRPSRPLFLQAAPGSTISSQTLQRPADSSLKPEEGVSARKSSMGMFSSLSLPQTAPTLSGYPSYNQESSTSVTGEYAHSYQRREQSVVGQRTSSASGSDDSSRYSLFGQNPVSDQPPRSSSGRYYSSVKG